MTKQSNLEQIARDIRRLMIAALRPKESHHIGCSFSIVEIVAFLYYKVLNINPKKPTSSDRDIFILSKGHGALAVYATLHNQGFFSRKVFLSYDKDGGILPEHITKTAPGIEFSSGSLGHGLPVAAGYALSLLNDKKKNQVYVLMSDGEFNEGSNWEAIMFAAHYQLSNLTVIVDMNDLQGYGTTKKVMDISPLAKKLSGFGWNSYQAEGHDFQSLEKVFRQIKKDQSKKPKVILAKTAKGKGIPFF